MVKLKIGLVLVALLGSAVTVQAQSYDWGSIAIDTSGESTPPAYGIGNGATEDEAKAQAELYCNEQGGACLAVVSYEICGAVAFGGSDVGFSSGPNKEGVEMHAVDSCGNAECKVMISDCLPTE